MVDGTAVHMPLNSPSSAIVFGIGLVLSIPALALAQPMVCTGDGRSCQVWEEADLRAAAADPTVEEIVLMTDIELTEVEDEDDSLSIADSTDGGIRHLSILSDGADPATAHTLWSTVEPMTLFRCWASDSPVELQLRDLVLDGMGTTSGLLRGEGNCSVSLDSVTVKRFTLADEEVMDAPATLLWGGGSPELEVRHSRFEDIRGTVLGVDDGEMQVTQSVFTNCRGHSGPGAIWIGRTGGVTLKGNVFWGCTTDGEGGGAITGEETANLVSWADAFVANRAPRGGAVWWRGDSIQLIGTAFAGNGTCETGSCSATTIPVDGVPQGNCNFGWIASGGVALDELELPAFAAGEGEDGNGGALALEVTGGGTGSVDLLKCTLLRNRAGQGGALSIVLEDSDGFDSPDDEGDQQTESKIRLVHNTYLGNVANEGAGVYATVEQPQMLLVAGSLWLEHDTAPLAAGDAETRWLVVDNHTDGPPLASGLEQVHVVGDTCGAIPAEGQLVACPSGCGLEFQEYFCGAPVPGQWDDAAITTPLHFGEALCPADTLEPCDSTSDEDCEAIDTPCVSGAGSAITDSWLPEGTDPADRGMTGYGCGVPLFVMDSDSDGTPDVVECDTPGDPTPPSMDDTRHPFAEEACNGLDDNCDGEVDEGLLVAWYRDEDGDGHAGGEPVMSCDPDDGLFASATDCDDGNAATFPGAEELYDDGLDNDCDGVTDLDAPGCHDAGCLATRIAPGDEGLQLGWGPGLPLGLLLGWRLSRRRR